MIESNRNAEFRRRIITVLKDVAATNDKSVVVADNVQVQNYPTLTLNLGAERFQCEALESGLSGLIEGTTEFSVHLQYPKPKSNNIDNVLDTLIDSWIDLLQANLEQRCERGEFIYTNNNGLTNRYMINDYRIIGTYRAKDLSEQPKAMLLLNGQVIFTKSN